MNMGKQNKWKWKRWLSFFMTLTIVFNMIMGNGMAFVIRDSVVLVAHAEGENPEEETEEVLPTVTLETTSFAPGTVSLSTLKKVVDYCYLYKSDEDFAAAHQNDNVEIPLTDETGGNTDLGADFVGLGSKKYPFNGTVRFAEAGTQPFSLQRAFFGFVFDTVALYDIDGNPVVLQLTRTASVGDGKSAPLFADCVKEGTGTKATWNIEAANSANSFSGLIGTIGEDAVVSVTFTNNSTANMESKATGTNADVGALCGRMETGSSLTVTSYSGAANISITSTNGNAGGLVGTMEGTASLSVSTSPASYSPAVTANGSGEKGYAGGLVGDMSPTATIVARPSVIGGTVKGNTAAGGIYGRYGYNSAASINLTDTVWQTTAKVSGGYCGGLFGVLSTSGGLTLTSNGNEKSYETMTSGDDCFGGVIGKLTTAALTDTVLLQNLKVNTKASATFSSYGGVFGTVDSAAYIKVDVVEVNATNPGNTSSFGGVIGTTSASQGVFLDLGDFKLTANAFRGGGVVGTFHNGVLRLSGTTNMAAGKPADASNCGQLIGVNDNVLVFALGTGADVSPTQFSTGWKYIRSNGATADDLGTWGEVVRVSGVESNIVTFNSTAHTVTINAVPEGAINDIDKFVKTALNVQLNNKAEGYDCLLFTSGSSNTRETLLGSSSSITIGADIDLTGTGITGFMRDGGAIDSLGTFAGTISGAKDGGGTYKITLATGEVYGLDHDGNAVTASTEGAGQIYRHQHNGLFSVLSGTVSNLKIDGSITVRNRVDGMNIGTIASRNGGNVTLTTVTAEATINYNEATKITGTDVTGKNIGGLIGFVGTNGTIAINGLSTVSSTINLTGKHESWNVYGGAIGKITAAVFSVDVGTQNSAENKLTISMTANVSGVNAVGSNSDCGGLIGHITNAGSYDSRTLNINHLDFKNCTIGNAASTYGGGLLGYSWLNSTVNVNGMTVTSATINNCTTNGAAGGNENVGVMCYVATGKWVVDSLSVSSLTMSNGAGTSLGMLVNKMFTTDNSDNITGALYLDVLNAGYTFTASNIELPASIGIYDEMAVYSAPNVVNGGAGVISINMNSARNTGSALITTTGTYQNKLSDMSSDALTTAKYPNANARYYYNLDKMSTSDAGQKLLLWSVEKYIFSGILSAIPASGVTDDTLTGTASLVGLSYYPIKNAGSYTLDALDVTFDYAGCFDAESVIVSPVVTDSYVRDPGATASKNQHYLMHGGLFIDLPAGATLTISGASKIGGTFLEVDGYQAALISGTMKGNLDIAGSLELKGLTPKSTGNSAYSSGYLLVNAISRPDSQTEKISITVNGLTASGYSSTAQTAIAKSLFGSADGRDFHFEFSNIQLDSRIAAVSDGDVNSALTTAYRTSRSLFSYATLFYSINTDQNSEMTYNFTYVDDWGEEGATTHPRLVTYGSEITHTIENKDPETTKSRQSKYSGAKKDYTNPKGENSEYDFLTSVFLPYVYTSYDPDADHSGKYQRELRVNYLIEIESEGCGTYNDPYIIESADQLTAIAAFLKSGNTSTTKNLTSITLPKYDAAKYHGVALNTTGARWCTDKNGSDFHVEYTYDPGEDNFEAEGCTDWPEEDVQFYLASAYYKINKNITLDSFVGLGGATANTAFRGVIVGDTNDDGTPKYTITNKTANPLINVSNGCVIKDVAIKVNCNTGISLTQANNGTSNAYFDYNYPDTTRVCRFYGGFIGELMGGDTIIDNSYVTYKSTTITLSGASGTIVPVGGYVGVIVYGGLIFKNIDARKTPISATGLTVKYSGESYNLADNSDAEAWAAIYVNPLVGRVINGYAVNETGGNAKNALGAAVEQFSTSEDGHYHDADNTTRTGVVLHTLQNGTKHYTIADIDKNTTSGHPNANKLNVTAVATANTDGNINVPNAQALFVLSLITQSCAGTAADAALGAYPTTAPSLAYGIYDNTVYGMSHNADYSEVGTDKPLVFDDFETENDESTVPDYSKLAYFDTANNENKKAPIPYIVKHYTVGSTEVRTVTEYEEKTETTYNLDGRSFVIRDTRNGYSNHYLLGTEAYGKNGRDTVLDSTTNRESATEVHFEKCASNENYYLWIGTVDNKTYLKITNKNGDGGNLQLSSTPYEFTVENYNDGYLLGSTDQATKKYINFSTKNNYFCFLTYKDPADAGNKQKLFIKETGVECTDDVTTVTTIEIPHTSVQPVHNYPARCVTSTAGYYDINLASNVSYKMPDSFRGLGCVGIYDKDSNENEAGKSNGYSIKLNSFDGKKDIIDIDIYLNKYLEDNYFNVLHKGTNQALNTNTTDYTNDAATEEHGVGLFDSVIPKGTTTGGTSAIIKNFTLSGSVKTAVFSNTYSKTNQELYSANNNMLWHGTGGVVGWITKRSGLNFEKINLSSISIEGSNYIGGLLAVGAAVTSDIYKVTISECNAYDISLKMAGAKQDGSNDKRPLNAMGAFVGKYKEGKVIVYGTSAKANNTDTSKCSTVSIRKYTFGNTSTNYTVSCGGIVGFSGHGFECYDMKVMSSSSLETPITIGYQYCGSAGGICALIQPHTANNALGVAVFKNCTVENININGRVAGGIYGGKWNNAWVVQSLTLENCRVKGNSTSHNTIISNGASWYGGKLGICAGGLVGYGVVYKAGTAEKPQNITISDCLVENYDISAPAGYCAGGFIGYADTQLDSATFYIHDSSVENCVLGQGGENKDYCGGAIGGIASKAANKMLGYNIKLDNVTSSNTNWVGAWIGRLIDSATTIQFVGIAVYGSGFSQNVGLGSATTSFVFADYSGACNGTTANSAAGEGETSGETWSVNATTKTITRVIKTVSGSTKTERTILYHYLVEPTGTSTEAAAGWSIDEANGTITRISGGNKYTYPIAVSGLNQGTIVTMPKYPFVNVNPQRVLDSTQIITGDGAALYGSSIAEFTGTGAGTMAAKILSECGASGTARQYYNTYVNTEINGGDTINAYMNLTTTDDGDRISTYYQEKQRAVPSGLDDFAVIVIANNTTQETTDLINRYIQLVTNTTTDYSKTHSQTNPYCNIDIKTCQQNNSGVFEVTNMAPGIANDKTNGTFSLVGANADSKRGNTFTLLDVQFYDPMSITFDSSNNPVYTKAKIAYHLYVPVYTIKQIEVEFYSAALSGTDSVRYNSDGTVTSSYETIMNDPTKNMHFDGLNTWVTQYIRYKYSQDDLAGLIDSGHLKWKYDKTVIFDTDPKNTNARLPENTYMVLVDPNGGADKEYYVSDLDAAFDTYDNTYDGWTVNLSAFSNDGGSFAAQTFADMLAPVITVDTVSGTGNYTTTGASNSNFDAYSYDPAGNKIYYLFVAEGNGNRRISIDDDYNEDYYISMFVPHNDDYKNELYWYSIKVNDTLEKPDVIGASKAHVIPRKEFTLFLADLFEQNTTNKMTVSPDTTQISNNNREITVSLTTEITIKNSRAIMHLSSAELYHAFDLSLTRYYANGQTLKSIIGLDETEEDLEVGIKEAKYSIGQGVTPSTNCAEILMNADEGYINVQTSDTSIMSQLRANQQLSTPQPLVINAKIVMKFNAKKLDNEFPSGTGDSAVGVNVGATSNLSYNDNSDSLAYSSMAKTFTPQDGHYYYRETIGTARLDYTVLGDLDEYDTDGKNSENHSRLGINGKRSEIPDDMDGMEINTVATYNVTALSGFENANHIRLAFSLQQKHDTVSSGSVSNVEYRDVFIDDYLAGSIVFTSGTASASVTITPNSDTEYVYADLPVANCEKTDDGVYKIFITFFANTGDGFYDYANYKVKLGAELYHTADNTNQSRYSTSGANDWLVYTNAKIITDFVK